MKKFADNENGVFFWHIARITPIDKSEASILGTDQSEAIILSTDEPEAQIF